MRSKLVPHIALATATAFLSLTISVSRVNATTVNQQGHVKVNDTGKTKPVDPENPENPVDPNNPTQQEKGSLRIDFVSDLDFGSVPISKNNRKYDARGQLFRDDTSARGSYIQITDVRETSTGWTLQMEQTKQFVDGQGNALTGAILSYDNAWANASHATSEIQPDVTRETLSLVPGEAFNVAQAKSNAGWGVWTIEFGASDTNGKGQKSTLYPLVNSAGKPVMDATFNKQAVGNRAVSLAIPDTTQIQPTEYKTEIIWTIAKLP